MKRWTVFYANLLYGEFEEFPKNMPEGAFIRAKDDAGVLWYERKWYSYVPINACDVPPEVKVLALLLS